MTNYNSPEEIEKRKNQEDPIIMYLIVRESLGMSIGKTAAQCAHASQMIQLEFLNLEKQISNYFAPSETQDPPIEDLSRVIIFRNWLASSFRKVVLKADEKEWIKLKNEIPESNRVIVVDAGLTELEPNTETVFGVWPMRKSEVPKVIKRLQVLK